MRQDNDALSPKSDVRYTYEKKMLKKWVGGAGYRSRYLSHAKRALYHLSYAPILVNEGIESVDNPKCACTCRVQ